MALRFDVGPFEKLHIGKTVLCNSHQRASFMFEGEAPILRGNSVLQPEAASNSIERLYCCVQKIYLEQAYGENQGLYLALMTQALKEEPSRYSELNEVDAFVHGGDHYKALKRLKKLVRPTAFTDKAEPHNYVRRQWNDRQGA